MELNEQGVPADELRAAMREMASEDKQWKERLAAGVSYPAGDDVLEVRVDEDCPEPSFASMIETWALADARGIGDEYRQRPSTMRLPLHGGVN